MAPRPASRKKDNPVTTATASRRSPRRSGNSEVDLAAAGALEDHESELESLFKLNLDAASGELPPPESSKNTDHLPLDTIPEPTLQLTAGQPGVFSRKDGAVRTPRRKRKQFGDATDMLGINGFVPFFDDNITADNSTEDSPRAKLKRKERDLESTMALASSFRSFIDSGHLEDNAPLPLALPVPRPDVAETSALRDFHLEMVNRHNDCRVPLPFDKDVAHFLSNLQDGEGVHVQLPALAFPNIKVNRNEPSFIEVGSMNLNSAVKSAILRCNKTSGSFEFGFSLQNVPSTFAELFVFQAQNKGEPSGSVQCLETELKGSLSAALNFAVSDIDSSAVTQKRTQLDSLAAATTEPAPTSFTPRLVMPTVQPVSSADSNRRNKKAKS